jgi:hypothetical protein
MVNWLCSYAGAGLRSLLYLPPSGTVLNSPSLILLFLYGNLFCYVASYPVLVFHATRVMDFRRARGDGRWPASAFDPYIVTFVAIVCAFTIHRASLDHRFWLSFALAGILSFVQLMRVGNVALRRFRVPSHTGRVSHAFDYTSVLARRRGRPAEETEAHDLDEGVTITSRDVWRIEFMDTYRHLREHGNSAFIFLLELVLAALACCVLTKSGLTPAHQLSSLGVLFAIWAFPAMLVHLLAQHLERRFSRYDQEPGRPA